MKKSYLYILIVIVLLISLHCVSNSVPEEEEEVDYSKAKIDLSLEVDNIGTKSRGGSRADTQVNITPIRYKIALVNFWLINDKGGTVNLINPDSSNPTYTESSPLILEFTSSTDVQQLLTDTTIDGGHYTGYKMQFLYLQMKYPVVFHARGDASEDYPVDIDTIKEQLKYYEFRLYFNAIDKYWKRDFVVALDLTNDEWFWLRKDLNPPTYDNFFIRVKTNSHPDGSTAPQSVIDLFHDVDFWGETSEFDNTADPIIVGTHSSAGGVDAIMQKSFVIDGKKQNLKLNVDVFETMNFQEDQPAIPNTPESGIFMTDNTLDLGPESYGDFGLHPMVPRLEFVVEE